MKARMTLATVMAAIALSVAACAPGDDEPDPGATTTAPPSATPEPTGGDDAAIESAQDLIGEWSDTSAEWVVTFHEDGTFVEDYQGHEEFRTGEYEYDDGFVSLVGGDGNTVKGEVEGDSLAFRIGTLTRP
ncbi:hypothetical protein [Aeromicrobium sp. CTD01-1L150]|uniref:hypothetical protein n=1 Tax=Aeromicrobium sp. CTD01-1L150 TaxID=3341830 RepID=UPI0035BF5A7E